MSLRVKMAHSSKQTKINKQMFCKPFLKKTAHARFFILLYAALHRSFAVVLEFWHDLSENLRYI